MTKYEPYPCHEPAHHVEPHHGHHYGHPHVQYIPVPVPAHAPVEPPCCPAECKGEKGDQGERGPQGYRGERGPEGQEGARGPQGEDGKDGEPGPKGSQGAKGDKGDTGDRGEQGQKGDQGDTGAQGAPGIQGIPGVKGDTGDQGIQGEQGLQGVPGDQGIQGIQGNPGLDALISCTPNPDNTCYTMVFQTATGEKTVDLGGCVTLFSCGYTGTPQCETPTGAPTAPSTSGTQFVALNLPRDSADIILQDVAGATGTIANVVTSVEGDYHCVEWDQTGEINFNILVDTTGLPTATKGDITCYPPIQPCLRLEAPAGTALNRKTGGNPVNGGWSGGTLSDGSVYDEQYTAPDYLQKFDEYVSGGAFSADFRGDGRMKVCYKHCFYEPVAAEVDLGGTIIEACNSVGVFTPDGTTVLAE